MMIYNETYIGTARTLREFLFLLSAKVPASATLEIASSDQSIEVEVWYDEDTNTVILK